MNLINRIKPEILEKIKADSEKYPALVEDITNDLENNVLIDELKFNTIRHISYYSNIDYFTKFDLIKIYEAFK